MTVLPPALIPWVLAVAPLFSKAVWASALVLLLGAIVPPGNRSIGAILRLMAMEHEPHV